MARFLATAESWRGRALAVAAAIGLLAGSPAHADRYGWLFPYFSGINSANQLTQTAPAGAGSRTVRNIGTFADGVGPVTAHDGTVYIGNQQGRLMALTPDGAPLRSAALSGGEPDVASGMVWNNDIYVAPSAPPQPASTLPPTQLYHPPLTARGNQLFACEKLDGDDCGKGDHRAISLAWCMKPGYAKVKGYDVDSRKVKAETLDGRFCPKNKCKVFDSIGCEM